MGAIKNSNKSKPKRRWIVGGGGRQYCLIDPPPRTILQNRFKIIITECHKPLHCLNEMISLKDICRKFEFKPLIIYIFRIYALQKLPKS